MSSPTILNNISSLEQKFVEAFPNDAKIHRLMFDTDAAWMVYMYAPFNTSNTKRQQYQEIRDIFFNSLTMEHLTFIEKHCHPKSDFGMTTSAKIAEKALLE